MPQLAYLVDNGSTNELHFVQAIIPDGSSWGGTRPVDLTGDFGRGIDLAISPNGLPAIAAVRDGESLNSGKLQYFVATTTSGAGWNAPVDIDTIQPQEHFGNPSMLMQSGLPLIVVLRASLSGGSKLCAYNAENAGGTAWSAYDEIFDGWLAQSPLSLVGGRPAFLGSDGGSFGYSTFVRATDGQGQTWAAPLELTAHGQGGSGGLAVIGGVPVVAYFNYENKSLMYMTAADADGTVWNEPWVIDGDAPVDDEIAIVNSNGMPVVCYSHYLEGKLLAASWY